MGKFHSSTHMLEPKSNGSPVIGRRQTGKILKS
jgi:hypothetical protein